MPCGDGSAVRVLCLAWRENHQGKRAYALLARPSLSRCNRESRDSWQTPAELRSLCYRTDQAQSCPAPSRDRHHWLDLPSRPARTGGSHYKRSLPITMRREADKDWGDGDAGALLRRLSSPAWGLDSSQGLGLTKGACMIEGCAGAGACQGGITQSQKVAAGEWQQESSAPAAWHSRGQRVKWRGRRGGGARGRRACRWR